MKTPIALAVAALISGTAWVQAQTMDRASMMAGCRMDYFRHCPAVMPGGGRIIACLSEVIDQISPECAALVSTASTCAPDVRQFCADVQPGDGRMQTCLIAHRERLSGPCAATLAKAASQ